MHKGLQNLSSPLRSIPRMEQLPPPPQRSGQLTTIVSGSYIHVYMYKITCKKNARGFLYICMCTCTHTCTCTRKKSRWHQTSQWSLDSCCELVNPHWQGILYSGKLSRVKTFAEWSISQIKLSRIADYLILLAGPS